MSDRAARDVGTDGGHPAISRALTILSVCGLASAFSIRFVDPIVGVIARDLDADPHNVALLSTAYALPYALSQPILGPIGDALGKERVIKVCLFVLAVTLAGSALTSDIRVLFALRILSGAAAGGVIPMALAMIGDRVPMRDRQVAISRFLVLSISGQLLGGTVAGLLSGYVGWRGVAILASLIATGAGLAIAIGFRHVPRGVAVFNLSVATARYGRLLAVNRARLLFGFVFVEGLLVFGIQPYVATLLEARGAGGPVEAGLVIAGFAVGGLVYTFLVRLLLRTLGLTRMLWTAGVIAALAFLTMGLAVPWWIEAGAMMAVGLGFYMLHNSFQTQVTEVVPDARASAVSLHAFSFFVGQALAPVVFGLGLTTIGLQPTTVAVSLGLVAFGWLASRLIGRTALS